MLAGVAALALLQHHFDAIEAGMLSNMTLCGENDDLKSFYKLFFSDYFPYTVYLLLLLLSQKFMRNINFFQVWLGW